jgi:hypothetical protein
MQGAFLFNREYSVISFQSENNKEQFALYVFEITTVSIFAAQRTTAPAISNHARRVTPCEMYS